MITVEDWADIRRLHRAEGLPIKEIVRPDEPERRRFYGLRPYLDDDYAGDAEYIDPARIPFSEIRPSSKVNADSDNLQLVTAEFQTDDGTWTVTLHQDTPGGKLLIVGIAPTLECPRRKTQRAAAMKSN